MSTTNVLQALADALGKAGIVPAGGGIDSVAMLKQSYGKPMPFDPRLSEVMAKATFSQGNSPTSGLTFYDLEAGAKFLYPVLTPLRNMIPRVPGRGGIQAAWRAITGINTTGLRIGVSGGNRGAVMAVSTADYTASYKGIGIESNVDFEAQYAAENFDDVRAIAGKTGLEALMIGEEAVILGGNTSILLGTTPTPTLTAGASGGGLSDGTYSVIVAALTLDGYLNGTVAGGVQGQITRTNADGSSDTFGGGAARKSNAGSQVLSGGTAVQVVNASVVAVQGAIAYAWFWGTAGNELLGAITTINSLVITAAAAGTQNAASLGTGDNSTNSLIFDGLIPQALKSGSNAYVKALATGVAGTGTKLTADGAGGIVEIDAMLQSMWDLYRLSPDTIWVNSQQALDISKKILTGTTSAAQRFVFATDRSALGGGVMVTTYINRFSMAGPKDVQIRIHPNMPPGMILATSSSIPYPLSGVGNVFQIRARQDYYQIEWPLRSRRYEYGVYADEVLQHFFPPSMGVIYNIAPG